MKKILIIGIIIYLGFWGRYMWIGSGEIEANQPRKLVGITATPNWIDEIWPIEKWAEKEWSKEELECIDAVVNNFYLPNKCRNLYKEEKCPKCPKIIIYEPELIYRECVTKVECDCNEIKILEEANMECLKRLREEKLRFQLNCFK